MKSLDYEKVIELTITKLKTRRAECLKWSKECRAAHLPIQATSWDVKAGEAQRALEYIDQAEKEVKGK